MLFLTLFQFLACFLYFISILIACTAIKMKAALDTLLVSEGLVLLKIQINHISLDTFVAGYNFDIQIEN